MSSCPLVLIKSECQRYQRGMENREAKTGMQAFSPVPTLTQSVAISSVTTAAMPYVHHRLLCKQCKKE